MFRVVRDIHTPDGIFAITDVPLVLFAIGFENPAQALRKRNADFTYMERKMFKDMPRNMWTPGGIFVTTNVSLVLKAPNLALWKRNAVLS